MIPAFHILAKPIGPRCNLNCTYCFYLEKDNLYKNVTSFKMSEKVFESFIKQYIKCQKAPTVNFTWQGGEPTLLGVDFFRRVVELQKRYADGKEIINGFQTNGILINDEWCAFFKENNFLVGLSIDGPEELHNRYRNYKSGNPSFEQVMRGLECLKKHQVEFNTITVVQNDNANYPLEIYNFLKKVGSGFMQFIPVVERTNDTNNHEFSDNLKSSQVTEWSVSAEQYGNFLCAIFDEWVRKDVGQQFVQIFDVALEAWLGKNPGLCIFRKTCGEAMAIEHNGDLYSCDHYVYPNYKLGNILDTSLELLVNSQFQKKFGQEKADKLPADCRYCEVRFICNGECPKHRFCKTPGGEEGLNYLCSGYKKFFRHIDPYMRFMANELKNKKSPANVMIWAKEKELQPLKDEVNGLCPS